MVFSTSPLSQADSSPLLLAQQNNCFLVDWLTVVFHDESVMGVMLKLGMHSLEWDTKCSFINGYPMDTYFGHIHIRWGADDPVYYRTDEKGSADSKARKDMGVCLDISGQGCREFEQYSNITWQTLFYNIFSSECRTNVTRLDLAYDDHLGYLDKYQLERDARDRNYVSKSKKCMITWSDDELLDIQGLTIEVGSRKSDVLIRIYDKAAERKYNDRHWIRVELQLRHDRAREAAYHIFREDRVGIVAGGILRNYCTFREPSADSNRCRWPIAPYWEKVILDMERVSIWVAPGEEYNFSKAENTFIHQYGQFIQAYFKIHGELGSLLSRSVASHPNLSDKYERAIALDKLSKDQRKQFLLDQRKKMGISRTDEPDWPYYIPDHQLDFAEICPFDSFSASGVVESQK